MINARRYERTDVYWPAEYTKNAGFDQTFIGFIKDVTPEGAFIEPISCHVGGVPLKHDKYTKMVSKDDTILVEFGKLETKAKVVWRGYSEKHRCDGVGVQFI